MTEVVETDADFKLLPLPDVVPLQEATEENTPHFNAWDDTVPMDLLEAPDTRSVIEYMSPPPSSASKALVQCDRCLRFGEQSAGLTVGVRFICGLCYRERPRP